MLAFVAGELGKMDPEQLKQGGIALGGLMLAFLVFAGVMSAFKSENMSSAAKLIQSLAIAIGIIVVALKFMEFLNPDKLAVACHIDQVIFIECEVSHDLCNGCLHVTRSRSHHPVLTPGEFSGFNKK